MKKQERKSLTRKIVLGALLVLALNLAAGPAAMAVVESSESMTGIESITGIVYAEGPDAGYFIMAESGDYLVVNFDMSEKDGRTVKATGWVSEGDYGKEIHVTSVVEITQ